MTQTSEQKLTRMVRALTNKMTAVLAGAIVVIAAIANFGWRPAFIGADMLGNLFAEAVGIFLTVVLIDSILNAQERRRSRPARFAAYQTANRFVARYLNLWREIVLATSSLSTTSPVDFFSDETIVRIEREFSVYSTANVYPPMPWHARINQALNELSDSLDRCIQRYSTYIDPDLLDLFHRAEQMPTFMTWKHIHGIVLSSGRQLSNFPVFPDSFRKDLQTLREMSKLLDSQSIEFSKMKGFTLPAKVALTS